METSGTYVGSRHHRYSKPWHLKELRTFVCQIKISPQMCIGKKALFFSCSNLYNGVCTQSARRLLGATMTTRDQGK